MEELFDPNRPLIKILQLLEKNTTVKENEPIHDIFKRYINHPKRNDMLEILGEVTAAGKSLDRAQKIGNEGVACFQQNSYVRALCKFNEALLECPQSDYLYSFIATSRASALFKLKKVKEALIDIDKILSSDCPENTKSALYMCRAFCYLHLKSYTKAKESFMTAEFHFEHIKEHLEDVEIINFRNNAQHFRDEINKISGHPKLPHAAEMQAENLRIPEADVNPDLVFATKSNLRIFEQNEKMVATEDIKKGEALLVDYPYEYMPKRKIPGVVVTCHVCAEKTYTFVPCTYCTYALYCSQLCKDLDWKEYHKWLCVGWCKEILDEEMGLALKILFRATSTRAIEYLIARDRFSEHPDSTYMVIDSLKYKKMGVHEMKASLYRAVITFFYLKKCTSFFSFISEELNLLHIPLDKLEYIIAVIIWRHLILIQVHGWEISHYKIIEDLRSYGNLEQIGDEIALAIYPISVHFQHSCKPNAVASHDGFAKIVKAITDIKNGDEITVGVGDHNYFNKEEEGRIIFTRKRHVPCKCTICTGEELNPYAELWLCPKCKGCARAFRDNNSAKCSACRHVFPLVVYNKLYKKAELLISIQNMQIGERIAFPTRKQIETALKIMKKIYYKKNTTFADLYEYLTVMYRSQGDYYKSIEYAKMLFGIHAEIRGETSMSTIAAMLKLCSAYAKRCHGQMGVNSELYTAYRLETEACVEKIMEALRFRVPEKYFKHLLNKIKAYLTIEVKDPIIENINIFILPEKPSTGPKSK